MKKNYPVNAVSITSIIPIKDILSQKPMLLVLPEQKSLKVFGLNSVQDLPKPREIEEILKDDDMAEHRQLLMSRQLMLEAEEEDRVELKGDIYQDSEETNDQTEPMDEPEKPQDLEILDDSESTEAEDPSAREEE